MSDEGRKLFVDNYKVKELKGLFPFCLMETLSTQKQGGVWLIEVVINYLQHSGAPAKMWDDAKTDSKRNFLLERLQDCITKRQAELQDEIDALQVVTVGIEGEKVDGDGVDDALTYNAAGNPTPRYLYHGTPTENVDNILSLGLLAMKRRYVYMYEDIDIAYKVAARHGKPASVLRIDAAAFEARGNPLQRQDYGQGEVFLADAVPAVFINEENYSPPTN